ncbi:dihydropteroate synthase [Candidatus Pantoea edessiphila]|uniref:Dihydropteroate synthase n=1 Tax=Candidatus Pantoea edessiphila TaxID=2044610 RepID=A0A2P5SW55_9GAMM|nr:dihydropteroate synthase [Candidatus Pantoea edessiphila]PPI86552.1 dihydropteroate synthase [Candidatus Pantoea edessiphila]
MKLLSKNSRLILSHNDTIVMGILNITPDSFSDGGKYNILSNALFHVNHMINAGASIIDVGGESTRPGAKNISIGEELERVIPIIEAIKKNFNTWISIDTSKPEVMQEALKAGVHMINDTHSLSKDGALEVAVKANVPVCIMHYPIKLSKYQNIVHLVDSYFSSKIDDYEKAGINRNNIILDPGFGFGKSLMNNYHLLANITKFHHFGLPLLVGISRKSMIGKLLKVSVSDCLTGSIACAVIALMQGVQIIRVHDVKETIGAINIVKTVKECSYG